MKALGSVLSALFIGHLHQPVWLKRYNTLSLSHRQPQGNPHRVTELFHMPNLITSSAVPLLAPISHLSSDLTQVL